MLAWRTGHGRRIPPLPSQFTMGGQSSCPQREDDIREKLYQGSLRRVFILGCRCRPTFFRGTNPNLLGSPSPHRQRERGEARPDSFRRNVSYLGSPVLNARLCLRTGGRFCERAMHPSHLHFAAVHVPSGCFGLLDQHMSHTVFVAHLFRHRRRVEGFAVLADIDGMRRHFFAVCHLAGGSRQSNRRGR